jgi:hypothetical protein
MTLERFADICLANPYRRKGMFYSEVYLFLKRCEAHDIQVIIESGVKFGMSTALLRDGFSGHLVSIDKDGDTAESFHSHDPQFRREAGDRLDDLIQHDYRRKYPDGPGLGIWEKKP